jgi:hypothetical protein
MMMQSTTTVPVSNTGGGLTIADKIDTSSPVDHVPLSSSSSGTIDEKKDSTSATDEIDHNSEYNPQYEQQHQQQQQQQQHYHNPYAINQYTTAAPPPHIIDGMVVPPQQVYVQQQQRAQQQLPLEAQFQSLGLETNEGNDDELPQQQITADGEVVNAADINELEENILNSGEEQQEGDVDENGEGEEEPIKLFVGQVRNKQKEKKKKKEYSSISYDDVDDQFCSVYYYIVMFFCCYVRCWHWHCYTLVDY